MFDLFFIYITKKASSIEENGEKEKNEKVKYYTKRSLFEGCSDEAVLIILSYGTMEDIGSTCGWQTKTVKHYTETISKWKAAENINLDNSKLIYNYIGGRRSDKRRGYIGGGT